MRLSFEVTEVFVFTIETLHFYFRLYFHLFVLFVCLYVFLVVFFFPKENIYFFMDLHFQKYLRPTFFFFHPCKPRTAVT